MSNYLTIEIVRRRVRLVYDAAIARAWTRLPRGSEDALNAISFLFPLGEAFFCRSVSHYRSRITDPALREAADRFIHQEANHSREHARSNAALRDANVLGAELETIARIQLGISKAIFPRATQLAITCALEHFTAMDESSRLEARRRYEAFINQPLRARQKKAMQHLIDLLRNTQAGATTQMEVEAPELASTPIP